MIIKFGSNKYVYLKYIGIGWLKMSIFTQTNLNSDICIHGVPKGGQKEKKLSGFGAYIFGIGIPRGLIL